MNLLIKSHTYLINFANIVYIRAGKNGNTRFSMLNDRVVEITCPYKVTMKQIELEVTKYETQHPSWGRSMVEVITLDY
jgi:hypothetical protein